MFNMLGVDVCAKGFGGLGNGICALLTQILYALLQLICKLLGTFVDLLNIAFYIFAGVDFGDGRFNIKDKWTQESMNILDYFIFNESVTKAYLFLALIALGLVIVFTIYKIIKQDYFDKAGPRSKGPIFRNVAISCISFILVIPIFYLIIHASSFLALSVQSAMGMDPNVYAGMKVFAISWSDGGTAMHEVNNMLSGVNSNAGSVWYLEGDLLFTLLADGDLVEYDSHITDRVVAEPGKVGWSGTLATLEDASSAGSPIKTYKYYTTFYWYIYFVAIIVALKAMWNLVLAMIQRIFKLLGLFLVAPAPISQYVLDDGAKYKEWLKKSIEEGLRLVVACFSFSIFLLVLGTITDIDFSSAFSQSLTAASGGRAEIDANVSASTLVYSGEFTGIENIGLAEGGTELDCGLKEKIVVNGVEQCGVTFFESLINAFLQCLLVVAAGGAIKDLDTVVSPLISGAQSSLDSGNTGGAVNAVGKAAMAVASSAVGGVVGGAVGALKNKDAGKEGAEKGAGDEEKDADKNGLNDDASAPTEGGGPSAPSAPTEGGPGGGDGGDGGDGGAGQQDDAGTPEANEPEDPNGGGDGGNDGGDDGEGDGTPTPEGNDPNDPNGGGEGGGGEGTPENTETPGGEGGNEGTPGGGEGTPGGGEGTPGGGEGGNTPTGNDGGNAASEEKAKSKWWALAGDKEALKAVGKDIANSKVGKFGKAVGGLAKKVGGAVAGAAKTVVGGAKNLAKKNIIVGALGKTLKLGFRAAKVAGKGVLRGLGAGLKTAGGAIATGIVGEGNVKAFLGAKGDAQGKENEAGKKKYDAAKTKAFNEKREERLSRATEVMQDKQADLNNAVTELNAAADGEAEANRQVGVARQEVVDARAAVDGGIDAAMDGDATVQASRATIDTATSENQSILDRYSKKYGREIKSIDDLRSVQPETKQGQTQLSKDIAAFEANQGRIDTANNTIASRRNAIETAAGANGALGELFTTGPLKGHAGSTYTETMSAIKQQKAAQQAIIDEKGPDSDEGRAAQQQLNELESAKKAIEGVGAETYTAAAQTRRDQVRLAEAEAAVGVAEARAAEAPKATETAKKRVAAATEAYQRSAQLVAKHETDAFKSNNAEQYQWDPTTKGSERRRVKAQDRRKVAASERMGEVVRGANASSKSADNLNKTIQGTDYTRLAGTPMTYVQGMGGVVGRAQQRYEAARQTFVEDPQVKEFLESHGVDTATHQGDFNVRAMNTWVSTSTTMTPEQKKEMRGKIQTYGASVTSYNNTRTHVGRMDTIQQQVQTAEQQVVNNNQRLQVLQNQGAVVTQVLGDINNGQQPQLDARTIRVLNRQGAARRGEQPITISETSTPEEVRTVAQRAQTRIREQQVQTIGQNNQLANEVNGLRNAFSSLVEDLVRDVRGAAANMPAPGANAPGANGPAAAAPQTVEVPIPTPVDTVPSSFQPFAAMANGNSSLSESDYERIQNEGIRANQALLNQIREQNKGIINTVEDIEREVKGDI